MTHTSGLTYGLFGETPVDSAYRAANLTAGTLRDLVRKLSELPLLHQPGERWEYSWSTDVLGYVIEAVRQVVRASESSRPTAAEE